MVEHRRHKKLPPVASHASRARAPLSPPWRPNWLPSFGTSYQEEPLPASTSFAASCARTRVCLLLNPVANAASPLLRSGGVSVVPLCLEVLHPLRKLGPLRPLPPELGHVHFQGLRGLLRRFAVPLGRGLGLCLQWRPRVPRMHFSKKLCQHPIKITECPKWNPRRPGFFLDQKQKILSCEFDGSFCPLK